MCSARRARRSPPRSSPSRGPPRWSSSRTPSSPRSCRRARCGSAAPAKPPRRSSAGRSRGVVDARLPGRLELAATGEVRDGAHTPDAVDWLLARLPERRDVRRRRLDPRRQGRRRHPRAARPRGQHPRRDQVVERPLAPAGRASPPAPGGGSRRVETVDDPRRGARAGAGAGRARARHRLALPPCRPVWRPVKCIRCRGAVSGSASSSSHSPCLRSSSARRSRRGTR